MNNKEVLAIHPIDRHVGSRLRMRRNMVGISQDELGKAVGITFQQIQKYERGTNRIGSSRLYEIAKVLNVPVSFFFEQFSDEEGGEKATAFAENQGDSYESESCYSNKETMALIQAYYRITDVRIRQKVLALIKSLRHLEDLDFLTENDDKK